MVIINPNPDKDSPPKPQKPEVKLTFLESLPDWRLFSRFGELPESSLRRAAVFYWLFVVGVLGIQTLVTVNGKDYSIEWLVSALIAEFTGVTLAYWGVLRVGLWIKDISQKRNSRFCQMHKGVWRLIFCLYAIVLGTVFVSMLNELSKEKPGLWMILPLVVSFLAITVIYWSIIRVCLWIYDGFKQEKESNQKPK
jgi:hypothetical protein